MTSIVVAILTKNVANHIAECIKTVTWADHVILEDGFSDDGTVEIAKSLGATVHQREFVNFSVARNNLLADAAALQAKWLFFVDADERVTPELAAEVQRVITDSRAVGWWVPRYNDMWGNIMRGGGWYPDYQLRLLQVGAAHYDPQRQVHELAELDGEADYLTEHLIHYNYTSLDHFKQKQARYGEYEAKILHSQGVRPKPWTYLTMPAREFWRRYVTLGGYKDGGLGLRLCGLMAWYKFKTYLQLRGKSGTS